MLTVLIAALLAQPNPADVLFKEGRALMKAGKVAEACAKFEQSQKTEPALGTLLNIADCEEKVGHRVAAYLHFNDALTWAERNHESVRADAARERVSALKEKLSWLAVSAPSLVHGLKIKANDFEVEVLATAQTVPVDVGEVQVVASAPGYETFETKLTAREGQTLTFAVPALKSSIKEAVAADAPPPVPPAAVTRSAPVATSSSKQWVAVVPLVVGVAGAALGTVLMLDAESKVDALNRGDLTVVGSSPAGFASAAKNERLLGEVGIAAGAVVAAASVVIFFLLRPSDARGFASLWFSGTGLGLVGAWP